MNLFKRGEAAKVLTLEVAWTERGYRMLKVLVFCLVALSVANTATAGNTCNSAINAVPVILLGPAGPPGPPGVKGDPGTQAGGKQFCTWRRPSWSKRTLQLLHLSCYVNAHLHYCWSEAVATSLHDITTLHYTIPEPCWSQHALCTCLPHRHQAGCVDHSCSIQLSQWVEHGIQWIPHVRVETNRSTAQGHHLFGQRCRDNPRTWMKHGWCRNLPDEGHLQRAGLPSLQ